MSIRVLRRARNIAFGQLKSAYDDNLLQQASSYVAPIGSWLGMSDDSVDSVRKFLSFLSKMKPEGEQPTKIITPS